MSSDDMPVTTTPENLQRIDRITESIVILRGMFEKGYINWLIYKTYLMTMQEDIREAINADVPNKLVVDTSRPVSSATAKMLADTEEIPDQIPPEWTE